MGPKFSDMVLATVCLLYTVSSVFSVDLATLLKAQNRLPGRIPNHKRMIKDGNPCSSPEKPFPCKSTPTCIPMAYVCDDNFDCEDGYDEDKEVCTAAHRPPVEDIMQFLASEKTWIIPKVFDGKSIGKVAHGLAVSQTVEDFQRRVGLTPDAMKTLKTALKAVEDGDEETMEVLGMPSSAWNEVVFFFGRLIKSGFNS